MLTQYHMESRNKRKLSSQIQQHSNESEDFEDGGTSHPSQAKAGRRLSQPWLEPEPKLPPKQTWQPTIDPTKESIAFYLEQAEMDNVELDVTLHPCPNCGRKFAAETFQKHVKICTNQKQRKVFDTTKMRTAGTELAQFKKPNAPTPPAKVNTSSVFYCSSGSRTGEG